MRCFCLTEFIAVFRLFYFIYSGVKVYGRIDNLVILCTVEGTRVIFREFLILCYYEGVKVGIGV